MTLRELIGEVSALGFDGALVADTAFITSLNRSVRQIYGERKITDEYSFLAVGERPVIRSEVPSRGDVFFCRSILWGLPPSLQKLFLPFCKNPLTNTLYLAIIVRHSKYGAMAKW